MTARHDVDRLLHAWAVEQAGPESADSAAEIMALVERTPQRRHLPGAWLALARPRETARQHRAVAWAVLAILLAVLAVGAALLAGARPWSGPVQGPPGILLVTPGEGTFNGDLTLVTPDGTITPYPTPEDESDPAWSPDGSRVAYWSWHIMNEDEVDAGQALRQWGTKLHLSTADRTRVLWSLDLTEPPMRPEGPTRWSPDGRSLLFSADGRIIVVDAEAGTVRSAVPDDGLTRLLPSWSPDGSRIAYLVFDPGAGDVAGSDAMLASGEVHVVGADGSGDTRVSGDSLRPRHGAPPAWAPDGKAIAYTVTDAMQRPSIELASMDGAGWDRRRLLGTGELAPDGGPTWSPAGTRVAYTTQVTVPSPGGDVAQSQLQVYDTATDRVVSSAANPIVQGFCWSPDGGRLAAPLDNGTLAIVDGVTGELLDSIEAPGASSCSWAAR